MAFMVILIGAMLAYYLGWSAYWEAVFGNAEAADIATFWQAFYLPTYTLVSFIMIDLEASE